MPAPLLDQRDLEFMLYELFDAESLTSRERYADHNRETFDAAINTARTVAEKYYLPIRQKVDTNKIFISGGDHEINENIVHLVLANSVKYLDLFGNVVIAWIWLKQGMVAARALEASPHEADANFYRGKLQAMRYFFRYELPEIGPWAKLLKQLDDTTYEMAVDWF